MKKAFSFIPKSQIVSYQEGYERGYHELPPSIYEKKCKDENSLTCRERELVDGLIQMEQELRTDRKERAFDPSSCSSKNNHKNMKKNANAKEKVKRTIKREDQKMENQKRKKCKPNAIKVEKKSGMNYEGNVREQALEKSLSTKSESCVSPDNIAKVTRITPSALAQLQERVSCKLGDMRKCVDDKALAFICRVVGNYGEDGGGSSCCHDLQVVNVIKCAIEKQQSLEEEFGPCRYNMSPCFIDMPHVTDILREKKYLNPRLSNFDILTAELRQLLCIAMALTQVSPEWESIQLPNLWRYYRKAFPNLKKSFSEKFDMIRVLCELRLIARRDATCVYVLVNLEDVEICMRRFLVEEDTVYGGMVKYVQTHDRHQRSRKVKKV